VAALCAQLGLDTFDRAPLLLGPPSQGATEGPKEGNAHQLSSSGTLAPGARKAGERWCDEEGGG